MGRRFLVVGTVAPPVSVRVLTSSLMFGAAGERLPVDRQLYPARGMVVYHSNEIIHSGPRRFLLIILDHPPLLLDILRPRR